MSCRHDQFEVHCHTVRLDGPEGGAVVGYVLQAKVNCKDCGLPFQFAGFPVMHDSMRPGLSADMTALHLPMMPLALVGMEFHPFPPAPEAVAAAQAFGTDLPPLNVIELVRAPDPGEGAPLLTRRTCLWT